jgi:hypothetical protein
MLPASKIQDRGVLVDLEAISFTIDLDSVERPLGARLTPTRSPPKPQLTFAPCPGADEARPYEPFISLLTAL